jgi:nucleotide-binding universal stress UspA family protein
MEKILVAVDQTKASLKTVKKVADIFSDHRSENITLIYVERMAGMSVLDDLLPVGAELEELKKTMQGTELQEMLDQKAGRVLDYYQNFLKEHEINGVSVMTKQGHPADEILAAAKEVQADLIVIGSRASRLHNIFLGSVSREVANNADVSVLIIR